jgi:GT2 family glycosyltransferase
MPADGLLRSAAAPRPVRERTVDVSVIVVNWNTCANLRACLRSVVAETRDSSWELIVVDNASADGSAAMVRAEFPSVRLVENDTNRGFAAANNQGLALANGRFALLLNPDTVVLDGAIDRAVRAADVDPSIGVLGCQVLVREGEIQRTCFRFPSARSLLLVATGLDRLIPAGWLGGGPWMRDWDRKSVRDVEVVSGMFMLVRREAIERVGPMDEAYFVYAEEADWCFRLRRAGWRCVFTPAARILHDGGGGRSTSLVKVRMHVQLQKSVLVFLRKNRGRASWLAAKAIYVAAALARMALWGIAASVARRPGARERWTLGAAALRFHLTGREPAR